MNSPRQCMLACAVSGLLLIDGSLFGVAAQNLPLAPGGDVVVNGSFEEPLMPRTVNTFYAPAVVGGWTVSAGSIDVVRMGYTIADGAQAVDMSGFGAGTMYQDLATAPGRQYALTFRLAGNPDGLPLVKAVEVFWGDVSMGVITFDATGRTHSNMGWTTKSFFDLVASSTTTRLKFVSLTTTAYGAFIDDVQVVERDLVTLRLVKSTVAGCLRATGKLTLGAPAPPGGTFVHLTSNNPKAVVPPAVLIKAGLSSKTFPVATSVVSSPEAAIIAATTAGSNLSVTLTLRPIGPKTVTLVPNPVTGGGDSAGTITLECPAGPGDIALVLTSSKPLVATPVPSSITIPAGTQSVPFEVMTTAVPAQTKAAIRATANAVRKSRTLVVNPAP